MPGLKKDSHHSFQINSAQAQEKDKRSLRSFYKKKIDHLLPSLKAQKQKKITGLLDTLPFWKKATHIAVYQALKDEPCISSSYNLWKNKICFPVIENSALNFYKSRGSWQKNSLSIFEPMTRPEDRVPLDEISVFLIPGRAFDKKGGRLGRGRGFYDKTLSSLDKKQMSSDKEKIPSSSKAETADKKKQALFIGVAFSEQVHNKSLPLSDHDILMDVLVTDCFVLRSLNGKKESYIPAV